MTLRDRFRTGAGKIFTAFSSMSTAITYVMGTGDGAYSTTTGTVVTPVVSLTLTALIVPVQDRAADGNLVRIGDRTVLVERAPAEAAATAQSQTFAPSLDDKIQVAGVDWTITKVTEDPASAMVVLNCRAPE